MSANTGAFWSADSKRFAREAAIRPFYAKRAALVSQMLRHRLGNGRVLEIGFGSGELAFNLAHCGFRVIAFDLSAAQVERARTRALATENSPDFWVGGLDDVPNRLRVDAACALGVLPYVIDHAAFLRQLAVHVRPGGLIILSLTRARSLYTLAAMLRHCAGFRPTEGWRRVLVNLWRTGIWSGGFVDHSTSHQCADPSELTGLARAFGFEPAGSHVLHNLPFFDRATNPALARWAWCTILCFRKTRPA